MFRGNLEHTGVYAGGGPSQLNGLVWKFKTGAAVFSSPAVSDGVVYFGSGDGDLCALDKKTGQEKSTFWTDDSILPTPAILDGVVYFGSSDGYLYAVRWLGQPGAAQDGSVRFLFLTVCRANADNRPVNVLHEGETAADCPTLPFCVDCQRQTVTPTAGSSW